MSRLKQAIRIVIAMGLYYSGGVWIYKKLSRRQGVIILGYHQVHSQQDPLRLTISPKDFEIHLEVIKNHYTVIRLQDIDPYLNGKSSSEGCVVVITFDDGFHDNYQWAYPLLKQYGLSATFFLTVGPIDQNGVPWFEILKQTIEHRADPTLIIKTSYRSQKYSLETKEECHKAIVELSNLAKTMKPKERAELIASIQAQLAAPACANSMMSWDEIRVMKHNGMDFGGHTVDHPILSQLTPDEAKEEIIQSKQRIEQELQSPIDSFAYPNGMADDFNDETIRILKQTGFKRACTLIEGINFISDRYRLYRKGIDMQYVGPRPWITRAIFSCELSGVFDWLFIRNRRRSH